MSHYFFCSQNKDSIIYEFFQFVARPNFVKSKSRSPRGFLPRPLLRAGKSVAPPPLPQKIVAGRNQDSWKKVRAKDIISPPIETSRFERIAPRGREATALRKTPRRRAAKWLGGLNSKRADLSLVSYQNQYGKTKIFSLRA